MKKVIFVFLLISAFACKKHKDENPVYKNAALKIEYSDSYTSAFDSGLWLNVGIYSTTKHYPQPINTTHAFVLDTIVESGQNLSFGAHPVYSNGSQMIYGAYNIKITFNGQELANKSFPNGQNVAVAVSLPKIE